jgi:SAM-dependent methyltransferase
MAIYHQRPHIDKVLGEYKAREFIDILKKWMPESGWGRFLKTDLREEAFGSDEILFSLPGDDICAMAIDIDPATVLMAQDKAREHKKKIRLLVADIRDIPMADSVFDVIISTSTLDHFENDRDLKRSLSELGRVAKPSAMLVLGLNNKKNILFRFCLTVGRWFGWVQETNRFYDLHEAKRICQDAGWMIEDTDTLVHIISPANRLLLWVRRHSSPSCADAMAGEMVKLFRWLGRNHFLHSWTGWFIALKCRKA